MIALAVALPGAPVARAQSAAPCTTRQCIAANKAWVSAAGIHQLKTQLVDAVRQFAEAAAGTYGDEGPRIVSGIASMRGALARWEQAIAGYEMEIRTAEESADTHLALGSVYLDRSRVDDALREFAAAGRLDARRLEVYTSAALAYDLANKPAEATDLLLKALALDRDNPILYYNLARQALKLGQRDRAKEALLNYHRSQLEAWRRQAPATPAPFERVSFLRQAAGVAPIFPLAAYAPGFTLLLAGQYEQALAQFQSAASLDPLAASSRPDVALAAAALRQGRLQLALTQLASIVMLAPDDTEAHRLLGVAYSADDQHENSIEQLTEATRLNPADERSRMALADAFIANRQMAEAQRVLDETLTITAESGQSHYRLGQIYQQQTHSTEAIRAFQKAAMLEPLAGQDRLYEIIGGLFSSQADFDQTVEAYLKRIEVNPNNADGHRKLAEIYFLQGRNEEALAEFTATLLLDPKSSDAHAGMGQAYLRLGAFAEAAGSSKLAVERDPTNRQARYALATALTRLGRVEEGAKELAEMQRLEREATAAADRKTELDAIALEAERASANQDHQAAIELLRKALTYEPNLPALYVALGVSLMRAGMPAEAIDQLRHALTLGDSADVHQRLAEAYDALGRTSDSQAQLAQYERLMQAAKEERLRKMAGAR